MKMKKAIGVLRRTLLALATATALLVTGTAWAGADPIIIYTNPLDVHVPNMRAAWCPGGRGGFIVYWCDGRPYPDGTQFHYDTAVGLRCVIVTGQMNPPDALPGGCGGNW
jgi:hypothetical protein